ncbi:MAG TPA: hypothetical protein VFS50_08485 [Meiothermus sp.]|jgi:hypothetical protein|nr:hypothetical protein [Meiothermus sp.]
MRRFHALYNPKADPAQRRAALLWLYALAPMPNLLVAAVVLAVAYQELQVPGWVGAVFVGIGLMAYWGVRRIARGLDPARPGRLLTRGLLEAASLSNFLLLAALAAAFGLGVWGFVLLGLGLGLYGVALGQALDSLSGA